MPRKYFEGSRIKKQLRRILLIYHIRGTLASIREGHLIIDVGGIGYKCFADSRTIGSLSAKINEQLQLFTEMIVREDSISLFGFLEKSSLDIFKLLISVSGVGSKVALSILSEFSPEQISMLISSEDSRSLTKASGLGKKLAQRIILELKEKIKPIAESGVSVDFGGAIKSDNISKAMDALCVLGYSERDIMPVLLKMNKDLPVEEMIKETLKSIG